MTGVNAYPSINEVPIVFLSVVIPALNEAPSLEPLFQEITEALTESEPPFEVIFCDDGSTDDTWATILRLSAKDPRVRGLRLRKNFGKAAALSAGVHQAKGDIIITMDADGQDDPAEIPALLAALTEGADVVNGYKQHRNDPFTRVLASRVFNRLVSWVSGVRLHDHNCGLKALRREVFDEIRLYGELHRFIAVMASARGFRIAERVVAHRPRRFGRSKYGFARIFRGFFDLLMIRLLTGYQTRPQHVFGLTGLGFFSVGAGALTYLAGTWVSQFWFPDSYLSVAKRPLTLYAVVALIFGAQLMSLGFLAGLLPLYSTQDTDMYSVRERTKPSAETETPR